MLPGDYIAYRLTGEMVTTESGFYSPQMNWKSGNNEVMKDPNSQEYMKAKPHVP